MCQVPLSFSIVIFVVSIIAILFYDENIKFSREKKTGSFSDKSIHIIGI